MSAEKRMDRLWHAACKQVRAMGRLRRSVRRNARVETVLSLVLSVGIVTTALLPSTAQLRTCETRERSVFTLVEGDYMNPLISSATTIHILNSVANEVAQFAGFDDFSGRVKVNDAVHLVNITRFSGCLLSILNLEFALRDKTHRAGTPIYISESFWKTNFGARTDILGTEVIIHELRYQIAGVIRDFDGLLATYERCGVVPDLPHDVRAHAPVPVHVVPARRVEPVRPQIALAFGLRGPEIAIPSL